MSHICKKSKSPLAPDMTDFAQGNPYGAAREAPEVFAIFLKNFAAKLTAQAEYVCWRDSVVQWGGKRTKGEKYRELA